VHCELRADKLFLLAALPEGCNLCDPGWSDDAGPGEWQDLRDFDELELIAEVQGKKQAELGAATAEIQQLQKALAAAKGAGGSESHSTRRRQRRAWADTPGDGVSPQLRARVRPHPRSS
jgi:hypothetical protein